jgi:hypothetical protein
MQKNILSSVIIAAVFSASGFITEAAAKPRVVVTTDPELDDSNSLIRYLLYSDQFETEGLIYASSQYHWKGDGRSALLKPFGQAGAQKQLPCPCYSWRWPDGDIGFIEENLDAYAKVYRNLKAHSAGYPTPEKLRSTVRVGNVEFVGDIGRDSPGSDLIKKLLLDNRRGPIFLLAWAGSSTIARALKSIEEQYGHSPRWPKIRANVSRKAVIQSFIDQDGTYTSYIKPNWPEIEYRDMATRVWGYGSIFSLPPEDRKYVGAEWTYANVSSKGPLGSAYTVWGDGKQMVKGDKFDYFGLSGFTDAQLRERGYNVFMSVQPKGSFISEGDTSTFMNLIDNGLVAWKAPNWGGWGGRSGIDIGPNGPDASFASARWFGAAQRDFAARLAWSVNPVYAQANHQPVIRFSGSQFRTVRPGQSITLAASVTDPDDDAVSGRWWQYREAGTYPGQIEITSLGNFAGGIRVPGNAKAGETIHLILEVTDDGSPSLTRYHRVVLSVREERAK